MNIKRVCKSYIIGTHSSFYNVLTLIVLLICDSMIHPKALKYCSLILNNVWKPSLFEKINDHCAWCESLHKKSKKTKILRKLIIPILQLS